MYLSIGLAAVILLLVAMRESDLRRFERALAHVHEEAAKERRSLFDRIQHPQVLQHPQLYTTDPPAPATAVDEREIEQVREETELAYIGMEVPPGVSVGTLADREPDVS